MRYYVGIDSSTSCTGIAVLDEQDNLIDYRAIYTKDLVKHSESLGEEFQIIYDKYKEVFQDIAKKIYAVDTQAHFNIAIEANSFGGYNTTMLLGITIGIAHAMCKQFFYCESIKYSAVGNWRSKILGTDPEEDMTNNAKRDELKTKIMNWSENKYKIHLPLFIHESDGIKTDKGYYDCRINDISDAIGLAYCCKNDLLSDRRQLKIETKRANNMVRSLKNGFRTYRKKVEEWYKRWKKSKSKTDLKTLNEHVKTLKVYGERLKNAGFLNSINANWIETKLKEITNEIQ